MSEEFNAAELARVALQERLKAAAWQAVYRALADLTRAAEGGPSERLAEAVARARELIGPDEPKPAVPPLRAELAQLRAALEAIATSADSAAARLARATLETTTKGEVRR